eukprot:s8379_g1.t1
MFGALCRSLALPRAAAVQLPASLPLRPPRISNHRPEQDASVIVVHLVELEEEEWVRGMKRKKDKERDLQKEERE